MKHKYPWEQLVKDCRKISKIIHSYKGLISGVTALDTNSIIPAVLVSYLLGLRYVDKSKSTSSTVLIASEVFSATKAVLPKKHFMLITLFSSGAKNFEHLTLYTKDYTDVIIYPWDLKVVKKTIKK